MHNDLQDINDRLSKNKITKEEEKKEVQDLQKDNRNTIENKTVDSHVVENSGCEILS